MRKCDFNIVAACNFINKDALAQVFSFEFCEIFKNTFFIEHLRVTFANSWWDRTIFYSVDILVSNILRVNNFSLRKGHILSK